MNDPLVTTCHFPHGRTALYQDNSCHGEDAYTIRSIDARIAFDAVLDGATGRGGSEASTYVAAELQEATITSLDDLTSLLDRANRELFRRGRGRFFLTTITIALKIDQTLHVLSVGDSPAILIRGADMVPLTSTARGQAYLGVTNMLGRQEKLSYKALAVDLQPGDRVLLATDGVIENMAPSELAAIIRQAPSPEQAASILQQRLEQKKHANKGRIDEHNSFRHDDATAIFRYVGLTNRSET